MPFVGSRRFKVLESTHGDVEEEEHDERYTIDDFSETNPLCLNWVDHVQRVRWLSDSLSLLLGESSALLFFLVVIIKFRFWCGATKQFANTSLQYIHTDTAWNRIMLLITRYVDDNDRYNEGEAEQVECMAIECHCGEWKRWRVRKFY